MSMDETCTWTKDPDGYWATDCGEAFEIAAGSPDQNGLRYCCFCGLPLVEVIVSDVVVYREAKP